MDGLIGIVVIIYLVASVVGAVVERMRRGPFGKGLPTVPAGEGQRLPQDSEKPREAADAVGTSGLPEHRPVEPEWMESGARELAEPGARELTVLEIGDQAAPRTAAFREANEGQADELVWEISEEWERPVPRRAALAQGIRPVQSKGQDSRSPWRQAVVMKEVIGRPRGLDPYQPPWLG
ncbi:MAG: hypothetical protein GX341_06655 [Firmicutes bacterium]|jgi:hypothetical protein|nr:hypothetical protein [Bacillota bacterium]